MPLRPYQIECLQEIKRRGNGSWLIVMACGLGKGHILPDIDYYERTLFIQHREELVEQNGAGFLDLGLEKGKSEASNEAFVTTTIQTLLRRKHKFHPKDFHTIVIDEAHRYAAKEWREAVEYFTPKRILGFTATPNRSDGKGLDEMFEDIIFERDIEFGIANGYLSPLQCERVDIGYDLTEVATRMGDFAVGELEQAVNISSATDVIKKIYNEYPKPTMVFCVNVAHAEQIAEALGIESITQKTKKRGDILNAFRKGKVQGIASVGVLTEGVNLNNARTLILARPTKSELLYIQMVGRVLRLSPETGKGKAFLVDCVGATGEHELCGAHTLLGLDIEEVPIDSRVDLIGDLLEDLPNLIKTKSDDPRTYIKNRKIVKLFAKKHKLKLYGINFVKHPDGSLVVGLGKNRWIGTTKIDSIGKSRVISYSGRTYPYLTAQQSIDSIIIILKELCKEDKTLWDAKAVKRWGKADATEAQKNYARSLLCKKEFGWFKVDGLNKEELSIIISRLKWEQQ